jgi:hypothetical protein
LSKHAIGSHLPERGINIKPNKHIIMKTKFLIPLLAGLGLLCACKGKTGYEAINNSSTADTIARSDSTIATKLVKTAEMHFKVKNVQQTGEHIVTLVTGYNGMVMHHKMGSTADRSQDIRISNDSVMRITSFTTNAEIIVKIPTAKLEDFMSQVAHMGIYVNTWGMDITDKSLDYLSSQLKLKNRNELVSQQKKGKIVIKNPADVLLLKDDQVDEQISNRGIDDAVKNSVVSLSFYESNTINKEIIANDNPAAYNLSFFKRLIMAMANGWNIFVDVIIGIANLWVFILAGGCIWIFIAYYKTRKLVKG